MFIPVLTQSNTFLIGDVAKLLGKVMEWLYLFFDNIGIANIGLCIISFTLIVKLLMIPLTVKQQRFSKLSSLMNPEIQAIQKKYKNKRDQDTMVKMNEETKAVYEKYGTSPTGGCLQLIIQMPIIFALYQVVSKIPAYVEPVHKIYYKIYQSISTSDQFKTFITEMAKTKHIKNFSYKNPDKVIDTLYQFRSADWNKLLKNFSDSSDVINTNLEKIRHLNNFIGGISLSEAPLTALGLALIIPVLAGLSQWYSARLISSQTTVGDDNPMGSSLKVMNTTMPLVSAFFTLSMPAGLGLYWVASSVFQIIQQLVINAYFNRIDMEDLVKKNIEKANKKREKRGLPPNKVTTAATVNVRNIEQPKQTEKSQENKQSEVKKSTEYYKEGSKNPNSISSKAAMVKKYNEKNK